MLFGQVSGKRNWRIHLELHLIPIQLRSMIRDAIKKIVASTTKNSMLFLMERRSAVWR